MYSKINTVNKKRNVIIFSVVPNVLLLLVFYFVITANFLNFEDSYSDEIYEGFDTREQEIVIEGEEIEDVELKELKSGKRAEVKDEKNNKKSFVFPKIRLFGPFVDVIVLGLIIFILYGYFKKVSSKLSVEEDDSSEFTEIKESLLTKDNIGQFFKNLKEKFTKKECENLPEEREVYKKFVLKLMKKGLFFEKSITANIYNQRVLKQDSSNIKDEHKKAFNDITDVYNEFRYGDNSSDKTTLNEIKEIYDKI